MCVMCDFHNQNAGIFSGICEYIDNGEGPLPLDPTTGREAGFGSTTTIGSTGVSSIDGLLSGYRWSGSALTFAFPTTGASYGSYTHTRAGSSIDETLSFSPATAAAQTCIRAAMAFVSSVTGINITETITVSGANIRVAESSALPSAGGPTNAAAYAYYPSGFFKGGDVWLGPSTSYDNPYIGSIGYRSIWHELGHSFGLKHAQDLGGVANTAVPASRNGHEFSVMTYISYIGGPTGYPNEVGGHPQSFMMDDIRALQQMYGANFTVNSGNTTYTFSSTTGEMFINGVGQGAPGVNRVFRTIWDGGGLDTYDFSNYTTNETIDLRPGEWSMVSAAQLVNLGYGNYARGNLANALQYNNDTRSLIENATGGSGNDTIIGNAADNLLIGGAGADRLLGGAGYDTLTGGTGADSLDGGTGWDTVSYAGATAAVQVIMYSTAYNTGDAAGDTFVGIEALQGSSNADILVGDFAVNAILGGAGDDWIDGTYGGDYLYGESGNDNLVSRIQADFIDGGEGFDTVRYDYADAGLRAYLYDISQNSGWAAGDTLISIEGIAGSYFSDDLRGDDQINALYGLGGNDFLVGFGGVDYLNGGAGYDLFYYNSITDGGSTGDVIQDFTSGIDRISFTGSQFGLGYLAGAGIESWRFVNGTSASYATSQFIYSAPTGQLWYDQDGTGAGAKVLMATLQTGATMTAADFYIF